MFRSLCLLTTLLSLVACGKIPEETAASKENASPEPKYAIATAHPLATEAGREILAKGGSAVDAAVAVQAILSLVEPQSSGLAGGAFLLHYDPVTDETFAYDGREIAPASATPTMFMKEDNTKLGFYDAVTGGRSVGVPGVVSMLATAHEDHGTLPLEELWQPARELAHEGFAITPRFHDSVKRMSTRGRLGQRDPAKSYFLDDTGAPLPVGHILQNPDYVTTLDYLITQGPSVFYNGPVADQIALAVNDIAGPGIMSPDDFRAYKPIKRKPVCATYRDKKICSMGPPSSGGTTVLQILKLLENTDFATKEPSSAAAWHLLMEASRLAYADRNHFLADPDYMTFGTHDATAVVDSLLSDQYLKDRAALIFEDRSSIVIEAGDPLSYIGSETPELSKDSSPEPPSTSHFSILDQKGRVVSMTTSVEFPFGSHLMAGGMILNNQLTDFSFLAEENGKPIANAPAAGKRPRSSMSPLIIFNEDGSVYASLGSPGGPAIIGYLAKTVVALIDWDMPLQDAIDLPNIVVPRGGVIIEGERLEQTKIDALKALGHEIAERELTSGVNGFVLTGAGIQGGADKRREGTFASSHSELN